MPSRKHSNCVPQEVATTAIPISPRRSLPHPSESRGNDIFSTCSGCVVSGQAAQQMIDKVQQTSVATPAGAKTCRPKRAALGARRRGSATRNRRLWRALGLYLLATAVFWSIPTAQSSEKTTTTFTAQIEPAQEADRSKFRITTSGDVRTERLETVMGGMLRRRDVLTFSGEGATLNLELPNPTEGPVLLEIEETHNRRPQAFGYTVSVNRQPVYFRTYQELGAGPNNFFIAVPPALTSGSAPLRISLRSDGNAPFSIARLWVYEDFFGSVAIKEKVYRPMALYGFKLPVSREGFESYSPVGRLRVAQYAAHPTDTARRRILETLREASESGTPAMLVVNGTLWGGMPSGPDGLGGYFSDPRYSATSFDPETGRFNASWPSMWGNTASPRLQEEWLQGFVELRFHNAMDGFDRERDLLKAASGEFGFALVREWGTSSCEVSPTAVGLAAKDGLVLNPADGLDTDERRWIFNNGVRLWKHYAQSTRAAVGRDSIRVDNGKVELPQTHLRDHLYSQPNFLSDWPVGSELWSMGEQGMVPGFWASGELGQGKEYREVAMYDYLRATGRLTMVNMERTILKEDFSVLPQHYGRGFQSLAFFNDVDGDERFIRAVDRCGDLPELPPPHREPKLLSIDYRYLRSLGSRKQVAASENVAIPHKDSMAIQEHRVPRLALDDHRRSGRVVYRIAGGPKGLPAGLTLHVEGRISKLPENFIEVKAGRDPNHLLPVAKLTATELPTPDHWTMHVTSEASLSLGTAMAAAPEWYLELTLHSPSAPDAAFLTRLAVGSQWKQRSGYLAADTGLTLRQQRTLGLWVQDRAVANNLLVEYARTVLAEACWIEPVDHGEGAVAQLVAMRDAVPHEAGVVENAADMIRRGFYQRAAALLAGELAQVPPARFAVKGGGPLGRYPVTVRLPRPSDTAVITLHRVEPQGVSFSIDAPAPIPVEIEFTGLDPAVRDWALDQTASNRFNLRRPVSGEEPVKAERGMLTITVHVPAPATPAAAPDVLEGRFLHGDRKKIVIDTQDLRATNLDAQMELPVASDVTVERKPHRLSEPSVSGSDWPEPMDMVSLRLEDGKVAHILALYGRDRGTIRSFRPPSLGYPPDPGGIELENGHRYDFHFSKATGTRFEISGLQDHITSYEFRHLADFLKPGQTVEVVYTPYATQGTNPRLRLVRQPSKVLLEEDFTNSPESAWKKKPTEITGVDVVPHKPEPNYLYDVVIPLLRPTHFFQPGHIVYKVKSEKPLGSTALEFAARAFEDSSRVEFFTSRDGQTWAKAGQFDNTWQNNYPQSTDSKTWKFPPQVVDLTEHVQGRREFYLKIQLTCGDADDRFCFGRFRVISAQDKADGS